VTLKPAAASEPSFIDELMENPLVLPGAGLLVAALGALGLYSARRRKQQKNFDDSIITDSSLKANSLFGSTGGQSVDTNNSVFNSNFTTSASQLDTNEVDPVAEADVYIAYGRDAQAEEILKEALRAQPDRHAVRVKLLEIYSNRKDLRAFEVLATEFYGLTKGEGEDWAQAAALGVALDPNNPLYADGASATGATAKDAPRDDKVAKGAGSAALLAPTQPLSEQGLATLLATTQSGASPDTLGSLGSDTSYFSNTMAAADKPLEQDLKPASVEMPKPQAEPAAKATSNDLDFDLDDIDVAVPNTIARPVAPEPSIDMAGIDFDFLNEPNVVAETPTASTANESVPETDLKDAIQAAAEQAAAIIADGKSGDDKPADERPLTIDFPGVPDLPLAESATNEPKPEADPLDFDLSEISLDLNPPEAESNADFALEGDQTFAAAGDESSSVDAEMATKLDLAIAYQEIGDKEGARELLDEVLKGGTAEQSEKARSLLLELA
jgi:pilus assembly protein FimV